MHTASRCRKSPGTILLFASLVCGLLLVACGQAPVDESAMATQAAAAIYADQTAQAQAFTPTPADTATPLPEPTTTPTPAEPTATHTPTPAPPPAPYAIVKSTNAWLRPEPSMTGLPLEVLDNGVLLQVLSQADDWLQVQVEGETVVGWVQLSEVELAQSRPEPTAPPVPTATPEPIAVPSLGEGLNCARVFEEDFTQPSDNWPSGNDSYSRWGPTSGEYQILIKQDDSFYAWSDGLRATDFVLEMDAYFASDQFGAYGLMFGLNSLNDGQDFYTFFVDSERYFALFSHTDDQWTPIVDWTTSPALKPGQEVNRLRVERREETISLSANGQPLTNIQDNTYTRPRYIALVAESFDVGNVDVRFDNIIACLSPTWPAATPTPIAPTATPTPIPPPPATPTAPPPPLPAPDIPAGKGRLIMLNCRGDVVTVDVIPVAIFQELAPKTGPDCKPGEPIILDPGQYILRASIAGVPSKGEATITINAGMTFNFTWY